VERGEYSDEDENMGSLHWSHEIHLSPSLSDQVWGFVGVKRERVRESTESDDSVELVSRVKITPFIGKYNRTESRIVVFLSDYFITSNGLPLRTSVTLP